MTKPPRKKHGVRTTTKAIIIEDGRLLTIRKCDAGDTFYVLPGGTQEYGETLPEALAREVQEETGALVEVGALRHVRDYVGAHHEFAQRQGDQHCVEFWFECRLLEPPGATAPAQPDGRQVGVEWLALDRLGEYALYPRALARMLAEQGQEPPVYLGDVN